MTDRLHQAARRYAGQSHPFCARRDRLLLRMVFAERAAIGFPSPIALARQAGVVVYITELPGATTALTDGEIVLVRGTQDRRELGLRIFRGLADLLLEREEGCHTRAEVMTLAARLAAPPRLMRQVGLATMIEHQGWAPVPFLRAWWDTYRKKDF